MGLKSKENEDMKDSQNKLYADPAQWYISTVVPYSRRLRSVLRYAKILQSYGVLENDIYNNLSRLNILEPGCGVGLFSPLLSIFGNVFSFDYSSEAIRLAKENFGDNNSLKFFEADGTDPGNIPELTGRKFDFILMKEFHPLTRNIIDSPKPVDIVKRYYNLLNGNGIMIIEHSLSIDIWKTGENILQTQRIIKDFKGKVYYTLSLDILIRLYSIFSPKRINPSNLSNLIVLMFTLIRRNDLSKTIVIKKER